MMKHLLEAAEGGDAESQFNLGIIYENGLNDSRYAVEGSRPQAMKWFLAAADRGLPRAQLKLAEMHAAEPDIPESSVTACGWYLLAMTSLHGAPSPEGSIRLPARLLPLDVVSNRRGQAFCGRLEAEGADH